MIEEGSIVPADIFLFECVNLQIDEAILTGEALPVSKSVGSVLDPKAPLGDRYNMAFKNTLASRGRGMGYVVATGLRTEIGKIAQMVTLSDQKRALDDIHLLDEDAIASRQDLNSKKCSQGIQRGIMDMIKSLFKTNTLKTPLQSSMTRLMIYLTIVACFLALIVFGSNQFIFEGYVVLYAVGVAVNRRFVD